MAALLLKGVCCRSAYQADVVQCVITAVAVATQGRTACRQLGYSGSQISKILKLTFTFTQ